MACFDPCVDHNLQKIEGAALALPIPLSKRVIFADEAAPRKTIKKVYDTGARVYDVLNSNGENNLTNLPGLDQIWNPRMNVKEFQQLSFDVENG